MDTNKNKDIENLFQSGFNRAEVPYDDGAWEEMELLLDSKKKRFLFWAWFNKKSNTFKTLTIMTLLTLLTSVLGLFGIYESEEKLNRLNSSNEPKMDLALNPKAELENKESTSYPTAHSFKEKNEISTPNSKNRISNFLKDRNATLTSASSNSQFNLDNKPAFGIADSFKKEIQTAIATKEKVSSKLNELESKLQTTLKGQDSTYTTRGVVVENGKKKEYVKVVKKEWIDPVYEDYYYYDPSGPIKDAWIGGHFTQQAKSSDFSDIDYGFNFHVLGGNPKPGSSWGLYHGVDWGMMFYGKSGNERTEFSRFTFSNDSGFARLRTNSTDLGYRMQLEYAKHRIVPYVNAGVGLRLLSTKSIIQDFPSEDRRLVQREASLIGNLALGARIKTNSRFSFDFRYEVMTGTALNRVNHNLSSFDGAEYQVVNDRLTPNYGMIKLGIVLDLSESSKKRNLVKEGYYKEVSYDSIIVEESVAQETLMHTDSTSVSETEVIKYIVVPCSDCPCEEQEEEEVTVTTTSTCITTETTTTTKNGKVTKTTRTVEVEEADEEISKEEKEKREIQEFLEKAAEEEYSYDNDSMSTSDSLRIVQNFKKERNKRIRRGIWRVFTEIMEAIAQSGLENALENSGNDNSDSGDRNSGSGSNSSSSGSSNSNSGKKSSVSGKSSSGSSSVNRNSDPPKLKKPDLK